MFMLVKLTVPNNKESLTGTAVSVISTYTIYIFLNLLILFVMFNFIATVV